MVPKFSTNILKEYFLGQNKAFPSYKYVSKKCTLTKLATRQKSIMSNCNHSYRSNLLKINKALFFEMLHSSFASNILLQIKFLRQSREIYTFHGQNFVSTEKLNLNIHLTKKKCNILFFCIYLIQVVYSEKILGERIIKIAN
ncbi:hypothetical protein ABEB36_008528 [Hypothenemus hampei]|uniref:Uncharacterized protein n=1 Tax=Hypothenemus hampei TaxID=57062 RepID=A0ABD1EQ30_HYPHA